jgi:hypothetical protein
MECQGMEMAWHVMTLHGLARNGNGMAMAWNGWHGNGVEMEMAAM